MLVRYADGRVDVIWSADGPEMSEQDNPIWHDFNADFGYNAKDFAIITSMIWLGCC
jgi:hypothetical protein